MSYRFALVSSLATLVACDAGPSGRPVLGFAQVSSAAPLDEARDGFFRALADSGYIRDSTIKIIERNAQGDIATLMLIMNEFKQRGVGYVATVSSIATQAALRIITSQPIVFGAVANPYIIGAGTSATEHKPNITGANIPLPLDSAFALAHEAFPAITTWGTLYDPSDPFAEFYLEMARHMAEVLGVKLVIVAATSPGDISPGIQALKAQGAGGVMQIPSVMIGGAFSAVVKAARQTGTPVVTANTGYKGVPLALGLSFYSNGYDAGVIMVRVLRGESTANIPFQPASVRQLVVDLDAAREFNVTIPESILARADSVLGEALMGFWIAALAQGLAFVALAWGVYLSARVLRFADISPDGTFPLGAAVCAALLVHDVPPLLATLAAIGAGMLAGYVTASLHTRLGVTDLLSGILMMTALYSVNLHVMGRSNISLLDAQTVATRVRTLVPATAGWNDDITFGLIFLIMGLGLGALLAWFLKTDFGIALRSVGDNPAMITAQGVDRRRMIELGLAIANGLVAYSGALIAQYQGFADVGMGVGTMVTGMAAVILGETLRARGRTLLTTIAMVAVGALLFRLLVALALRVGLNPIDLKLMTALFVLVALALPRLRRADGRTGRRAAAA